MSSIEFTDFNSLRRYFHIVTLQTTNSFASKAFARDAGCKITGENKRIIADTPYSVYSSELISDIPYYNGDADYSVNGNNLAPYRYDIFLVDIPFLNMLAVAFPFRLLAKETINTAIRNKRLLSKAEFVKTNINYLLRVNETLQQTEEDFTCFFSRLDLLLAGDANISSVNLDGDRPLESRLYKDVFQKLVAEEKCQLERCSLRCQLHAENENSLRTKANVHMDSFGNLKFYLHKNGANLHIIPYLLNLLNEKKCLGTTLVNPIERLRDDT